MTFLTLAFLFFFPYNHHASALAVEHLHCLSTVYNSVVSIDSLDHVIFDIDQSITNGDYVDVPVIISSDDLIFTLDFSMLIDTANLEFVSVIDHTGDLQYAAFLNPNDLKLRFTSNSFNPYPTDPQNVISIRFKVESGVYFKSDLGSPVAYLNGEPCSVQCNGEQYILANKEIETHESFISPNPVSGFMYINTDEEAILNMFDLQGNRMIQNYPLHGNGNNEINTKDFPRGIYFVSLQTNNHIRKTQKIVLQ